MSYTITFAPQAEEDLKKLKKDEPRAFNKATRLIFELMEHPETGTGKPERLTGDFAGKWSRRINRKHRLIYEIDNNTITVLVLSSYGHYSDK
ncbi:MAG: Txe/YoeB family addiction module toxin [Bacteroidales bacterium]|nr:Txe/YoeB family addiction module toxin [Bacteroidales bacterium]